ncbi:hypothetical protein GCM10009634_09740 [Saccharothrix xinjiangensis]
MQRESCELGRAKCREQVDGPAGGGSRAVGRFGWCQGVVAGFLMVNRCSVTVFPYIDHPIV